MEYNSEIKNGKSVMYGFATYPDVVMYKDATGKTPIQHLIFGDYINLLPNKDQENLERLDNMILTRSRGTYGWINVDCIQKNRILEVNFIDIGQGDGCYIVTPEDKHIIIDAGQEDNMFRFLSWRFNLRKTDNKIHDITAVLTHPDKDHYRGFQWLFSSDQLLFSKVCHNGIVERKSPSGSELGGFSTLQDGEKYLSEILFDDTSVKNLLSNEDLIKGKEYPTTLLKAVKNNPELSFQMLHAGLGYLPGYEQDKDVSLQILGPVCKNENGVNYFNYFSNDHGKTKNGHSISLMLRIGKLKIFLGGDLNVEAENYLLQHYTGKEVAKIKQDLAQETDSENKELLIKKLHDISAEARKVYQADIAKACHHGSHHFTTEFLKAINPIATIISSGDNETYAHPRPDALGAFGKYSRGERPLIFSTELARSAKELIKRPNEYKKMIKEKIAELNNEQDLIKRAKLQASLDKIMEKIERSVAVYGLINVRTDGEKVIICQKLESRGKANKKWDIHELVFNSKIQDFEYKIKLQH